MRKLHAALVLLLLVVTATYANHFSNGFHFDDFHTVVDNPAIRSLANLPRFFTDTATFSVLPTNRTYRPMVSATLAMDYALGQRFAHQPYAPFWFHLGTFVLFLSLIVLVYLLYRRALDLVAPTPANPWLSLIGAAWFGLHPAMAETVNYVIQRGDLYCTLGCVAALVLWARHPSLRRYGLYLLPLVFALLSKPPAAVFPVLLFLYVFFFESDQPDSNPHRWRKALLSALPSVAITAALLALQSAMTPRTYLPSVLSPWSYRLTQPYVWLRYCVALFLPLHLNADTDLNSFTTLTPQATLGLVFLAILAVTIWLCTRRRTLYPIAFGLLWFVVTQLPTSAYPLSEVENDHRMFFSFIGLILAAIWAGHLLVQRLRLQKAAIAIVLLALCGYAYGSHQRNAVWHDEESLWLDDVQKSPHNGRGLMIYGLTQMNKGAYPVALVYFQRAFLYTPNYPSLEINLGVVTGALADQGDPTRTPEAERHFQRAIALAPKDDGPHAFYGRWLSEHGRFAEAIAQFQTAIDLNPDRLFQREQLILAYTRAGDLISVQRTAQATLALAPDNPTARAAAQHPIPQDPGFWLNLSLTQYRQGAFGPSIHSARRALTIHPGLAEAYVNIGAGYGALHQWDQAIENERQALTLSPNLQIAKNNLAAYQNAKAAESGKPATTQTAADLLNESLALNQAGQYDQSIAAARAALRLDPHSALAWNNIAAANEALHRWDAAIEAANKALALDPTLQIAKNNLAWSISQKKAGAH